MSAKRASYKKLWLEEKKQREHYENQLTERKNLLSIRETLVKKTDK